MPKNGETWIIEMQIAGGLYTEICVVPSWHEEFGSGGRAAAAVSKLSPGSVLHTYAKCDKQAGIDRLKALGIEIRRSPCQNGVVFAYFHPLSTPHIEPTPAKIFQNDPIHLEGKAVLRFGFLDGDAIVKAERAVYDPQTSKSPAPFYRNGSTAKELALIVNAAEAISIAPKLNALEACREIVSTHFANVVVLKRGPFGAVVFEDNGSERSIPAYRSDSVFKIGTGDVFSAIFAYYWAEEQRPPAEAADLASQYVSLYVATRSLPEQNFGDVKLVSVGQTNALPLRLEGKVDTIGRRYTLEEACFRLRELGAEVVCPLIDGPRSFDEDWGSLLVLSDQPEEPAIQRCIKAVSDGRVVTLLLEISDQHSMLKLLDEGVNVTSDFATALYQACWST
ncbi:carbohydrate kinase family protein [uncultured Ruegeria sp.]|uniref:carbohydrate kinase family protein n=1 Tax=uncultured Ruegeria sp. TaxID=259304 RepID=UPI00262F998A|nr:carbohydrate kinase family protein [uncultured Ruegeria sp.]